jgi:serine phosphatase RsbU (regulator of sigma subunit)
LRHVALAAVLVLIFLASALWVRGAIAHGAAIQQQLQSAQFERGRLLKLQLDEETGLRGYLAAGSRVYLQPYEAARRTFPAMSAQLEHTVLGLQINPGPVRRERAINAQWLQLVALPSLRGRRTAAAQKQRLGKSLVDAFRKADNQLTAAIQRRSMEVAAASNGLITRALFGAVALGVLVVLIVSGYGFTQNRLSRRLEKERHTVEVLQNAFLRPDLPSFPTVALHGAYAPAGDEARVGGDWYDAYVIGERRLLFSIGDVSGHGLEAAVMMSRVRQSITTAAMVDSDPAAVLRVANEVLLLQDGRLVTVACGCADLDTGKVTYATAGHPPMLLVPPRGSVQLLATDGPPLGATANPPYRASSLQVEAGSALVLYTDGLTEHARDTVEGERALIETVRAMDFGTDDPAAALLASILSGTPPADDVAILTLTFLRAPKRSLRVRCA